MKKEIESYRRIRASQELRGQVMAEASAPQPLRRPALWPKIAAAAAAVVLVLGAALLWSRGGKGGAPSFGMTAKPWRGMYLSIPEAPIKLYSLHDPGIPFRISTSGRASLSASHGVLALVEEGAALQVGSRITLSGEGNYTVYWQADFYEVFQETWFSLTLEDENGAAIFSLEGDDGRLVLRAEAEN